MWSDGYCKLGWCLFLVFVLCCANYASPFLTEKAKLRSKASSHTDALLLELTVTHSVPRLQNQDIMFTAVHSLRCQVTFPGMYKSQQD